MLNINLPLIIEFAQFLKVVEQCCHFHQNTPWFIIILKSISLYSGTCLPDRIDAAVSWPRNGKTYFFIGPFTYQIDDTRRQTAQGWPRVSDYVWTSFHGRYTDAATINPSDNYLYLFQVSAYFTCWKYFGWNHEFLMTMRSRSQVDVYLIIDSIYYFKCFKK